MIPRSSQTVQAKPPLLNLTVYVSKAIPQPDCALHGKNHGKPWKTTSEKNILVYSCLFLRFQGGGQVKQNNCINPRAFHSRRIVDASETCTKAIYGYLRDIFCLVPFECT